MAYGWKSKAGALVLGGVAGVFLTAVVVPGCTDPHSKPCPIPGETYWLCTFLVQRKGCGCWAPQEVTDWACANNPGTASEKAEVIVGADPALTILSTKGCVDTGQIYPQTLQPELTTQTIPPPSCDGTTGDNDCVTCAKVYCCEDYQACFQDLNCTCWVDCLAGGITPDVCAMAANCGPPDAVATQTASCLSVYCKTSCVSMGDACSCGSASSSASSGGGGGP